LKRGVSRKILAEQHRELILIMAGIGSGLQVNP
jgi:hypothetical protein